VCLIDKYIVMHTASLDETVQVLDLSSTEPPNQSSIPMSIQHPTGVRCILPIGLTDLCEPYLITGAGDILRVYDVSSLKEPELINEIDAHWHDLTDIHLWIRKTVADDGAGITRVEPWVISASLDETIRKWKLSGQSFLSYCLLSGRFSHWDAYM
jgi:WD40 repeat protein